MDDNASTQRLVVGVALVLALCSLMLLGAVGTARALPNAGFVPDQIIVKLAEEANIGDINTDYGTRVEETLPDAFPDGEDIYLLELVGRDRSLREVLAEMRDEIQNGLPSRLVYAELNFFAEAPEADARHRAFPGGSVRPSPDNYSSEQYAASALNLSSARAISQGEGTVVAVLDTGAQLGHPVLKTNLEGVARRDFVDDDDNPSEPALARNPQRRGNEVVGHGTHVAGIVDLVAPKAKIMPLRVLDRRGYGNVFDIVQAIHFANSRGADVINLSLGTPSRSALLRESVEDAIDDGATVVAAAGNDSSLRRRYPAARSTLIPEADDDDGLLAVTSVSRHEQKSAWANYGRWVDIAAPGERIQSAYPISRYAAWSGTSMATPFVAGQAALVRNVNGSLDPAGVEQQIRSSARCLIGTDITYGAMLGAGHTDVGASLGQPEPTSPCPPLS